MTALRVFETWVIGDPVSSNGPAAVNVAAMGDLIAAVVGADGKYRPDGPARLHDLLYRVTEAMEERATPLPKIKNSPGLIIKRGRMMFGVGMVPVSARIAITATTEPGHKKDADNTARNQLIALLDANSSVLKAVLVQWQRDALGRRDDLTVGDFSHLDADRPSGDDDSQLRPLTEWWGHWDPPRLPTRDTEPIARTWPSEPTRSMLLKLATMPCGSGCQHKIAADGREEQDSLLTRVVTMSAGAASRYLRIGIETGTTGRFQRAFQLLDTEFGASNKIGTSKKLQEVRRAEHELFSIGQRFALSGGLLLPVPAPADPRPRAKTDANVRRIVTAQLQLQVFRTVTIRRQDLHRDLTPSPSKTALTIATRLPNSALPQSPASFEVDDEPVNQLRSLAELSRNGGTTDRAFYVTRWLELATHWRPTNGPELMELAVMVEQLDWDLVALARDRDAATRKLRDQVWRVLDDSMHAVNDQEAHAVVAVLKTHRDRASAVIRTKLGDPQAAVSFARSSIDMLHQLVANTSLVPSALATDTMQQSVLAYSGHWTALAERKLSAAERTTHHDSMPLPVVLRAALVWGRRALYWLDAVMAVESAIPQQRWHDTGRLAVRAWQVQARSIAIRAIVASRLALVAGLVKMPELEQAGEALRQHSIEPSDSPEFIIDGLSIARHEKADLADLATASAACAVLQEMLECRDLKRAHRGTLLQSALLTRAILSDSESMPALPLPDLDETAHSVLGDLTLLWRESGAISHHRPALTDYAYALDALGGWDIGWLERVPLDGMLLTALKRKDETRHQEIMQMLHRGDPATAAAAAD